jgi:hypothetical protein
MSSSSIVAFPSSFLLFLALFPVWARLWSRTPATRHSCSFLLSSLVLTEAVIDFSSPVPSRQCLYHINCSLRSLHIYSIYLFSPLCTAQLALPVPQARPAPPVDQLLPASRPLVPSQRGGTPYRPGCSLSFGQPLLEPLYIIG